MNSSEFLDPLFLGFVLDQINEAVILIDKNAKINYANLKACEILDYSNNGLKPLFIYEINPGFQFKAWSTHWKNIKKAGKLIFESSLQIKDKPALPIEVSASFYVYNDLEFELVIFRDIRERKDLLSRLKSDKDYNRGLFETTLDPLAVIDPNGLITDANKAMETVTGLSRLELIGTNFAPYLNNPENAAKGFIEIFKTGQLISKLVNIKNINGTFTSLLLNANTIFNENGQITGVFIACKDISERLKFEAELQLQNERYRTAQTIGHVGNWEYNLQTNEFWGSDEAKKLYGFAPGESTFTTEEVESCIPERLRVHQALIDLIEKEKPYDLEFEIHPRDVSSPRMIASIAILHKDALGQPERVTGVVQDVTERCKLQKQATQLAEIVRTSEEAIIGKTPDDIITSWNKGAEKIFGFTDAEMLGNSMLAIIPERFQHQFSQINQKVQQGEKIEYQEVKSKRKDGHEIYISFSITPIFDSAGAFIATSVIAREVTEQKIERMISGARSHLLEFSLTHSLNDLLEETINEVERLTESQIGFFHFIDEDQQSLSLRNWSSRTKSEFCLVENPNKNYPIQSAGVWMDCYYLRKPVIHNDVASLPHLKGSPVGHPQVKREMVLPIIRGNKVEAVLGVGNKQMDYDEVDTQMASRLADLAWEITEFKRSQEDLQSLNQQLEARVQERTAQLKRVNEDLEAFAYSVSHDLRAPLRQIDGLTQLLQNELLATSTDKSRHYTQSISSVSEHMGHLIDDLLSFSRMSNQQMTTRPVNLRPLIDEVIQEFEPEMRDRKVKWTLQDLPLVYADQSMMRVVLSNLISNALKFTRTRKTAKILLGSKKDNDKVVIFINDNGVGFDMRYYSQLFAVFQRLHSNQEFEGTGIGLATVKRIIERHGGQVWAESKEDRGTTFYFSLPAPK